VKSEECERESVCVCMYRADETTGMEVSECSLAATNVGRMKLVDHL
jgi:hypothetical protein